MPEIPQGVDATSAAVEAAISAEEVWELPKGCEEVCVEVCASAGGNTSLKSAALAPPILNVRLNSEEPLLDTVIVCVARFPTFSGVALKSTLTEDTFRLGDGFTGTGGLLNVPEHPENTPHKTAMLAQKASTRSGVFIVSAPRKTGNLVRSGSYLIRRKRGERAIMLGNI